MFVSQAFAQSAGGTESAFVSLLPFVGIIVIMYFLLIRPQQKKAKAHREMIGALRRGDTVVTAGGLVGRITRVRDEEDRVTAEIARGVEVEVVRGTITACLSKSQPAPEKKK